MVVSAGLRVSELFDRKCWIFDQRTVSGVPLYSTALDNRPFIQLHMNGQTSEVLQPLSINGGILSSYPKRLDARGCKPPCLMKGSHVRYGTSHF